MLLFSADFGLFFLHALPTAALLFCGLTSAKETRQASLLRWNLAQCLLALHFAISLLWLISELASLLFEGPSVTLGGTWFRATGLSLTMLCLISFIGWIVLRYARSNLANDNDNKRFLIWYLAVLLAVQITVTTNQLIIFAAAWASISLCLHKLLLFYPERPRANLAAHKKFLFARLSETLLLSSFALIYFEHGTGNINTILLHYTNLAQITAIDHLAACLLALVALIKCAQLPLHGWLIQVVESPTPVSALLHAGIVNLGGFLLLLFAPLLSAAFIAQWILLIVAGLSCVIASLVMMTRISIKVRLAWSTVAQMGLMLIECALGLYEIALLHLIAHSCYKAHAFLSSGDAVNSYLRKQYVLAKSPTVMHWLLASACVAIAALVLFYVASVLNYLPTQNNYLLSPWVLIAIASTSLLAYYFSASQGRLAIQAILLTCGAALTYALLAAGLAFLAPNSLSQAANYADAWVVTLFISLFLAFLFLQNPRPSKAQRAWFISLNAGFYLDEWATRATLSIWPITLPSAKQSANLKARALVGEATLKSEQVSVLANKRK